MLLSHHSRVAFLVIGLHLLSGLMGLAQTILKDILPGPTGSSPSSFVNVNGVLYFIADDGVHGPELWKSNGTASGTVFVKDINPGPKGSAIQEMTVCNGLLFFSAFSTTNQSRQLWRSDGTAAGTFAPYDGHKDAEVQGPVHLTKVGNRVFFVSRGSLGGTDQWLLYRSDGTDLKSGQPGGTAAFFVSSFNPSTDGYHPPTNFTDVNGTLYLTYNGAIYKTTTAPDDPNIVLINVKEVPNVDKLVSYQNKLFFRAGIHKSEIWSLGSTAESMSQWATTGLDPIVSLTRAGNYLYFVTGLRQGTLWAGGTKMPAKKLMAFSGVIRQITTVTTFLSQNPLKTPSADQTYFIAGNDLFLLTTDSWKLTKLAGSYKGIFTLVSANKKLYFLAGKGLYQTSPSEPVSTLVSTGISGVELCALPGRLYLSYSDPSSGPEPCFVTIPGTSTPTSQAQKAPN